jgi:hypothetical protein
MKRRKGSSIKVYLDDKCESDRLTPPGWVGVRTYQETIALLKTGSVKELDLDHDLGDQKIVGSGYDVLEWLEHEVALEKFIPPSIINIHSANPSVYPKMELAIKSIKKLAQKNERRNKRKKSKIRGGQRKGKGF